MIKVKKRNGNEVYFDLDKIEIAINNATLDCGIDEEDIAKKAAALVWDSVLNLEKEIITIEEIQDLVEISLITINRPKIAKAYILYRHERERVRNKKNKKEYNLLSNSFLSKYKHKKTNMEQLGNFVYYRTYSRWLPDEQRRENWWETVARAVDYNCSLVNTSRKEAEKLYDNVFNLKQFLSGRTFWVGGTPVAKDYPMANYNCAFTVVDSFKSFRDLFYLLMVGAGVGIRIKKEDAEKLPKIRSDFEIIHEDYTAKEKTNRNDSTSLVFKNNNSVLLEIGDSKEGWVQSVGHFFEILFSNEYRNIKIIRINYNNVRPRGEILKTFGGTASGHQSIKNMFLKIDRVIKNRGRINGTDRINLKPIDCLDITNIIGENVVVGGVRRTAMIDLIDSDDKECIEAKSKLYKKTGDEWKIDEKIIHRQMSNNSIYYDEKPTREQLHWQIEQMRYSGEPGWINSEAGKKRRDNFQGTNPCGEILLDSNGLCNLTTINVFSFINEETGMLDIDSLLEAQGLSVRAAYRMTTVELELPEWDKVQQRDKLLGCSLTGWQDLVNELDLSEENQIYILKSLREVAHIEAKRYSGILNDKEPLLITTVKPEGTLSQLPSVSSGLHYSHSPFYIRRVRINANDPLVKVCEDLEYPIFPEVGQTEENCTTKVIEFPVKSPEGITKYDVSAIKQLENYKMFMDNYIDHNASITVHVRNDEWEEVEEWVWNNWNDIVALSFLSLDDNFYELLPYESITEEEYEERMFGMKKFIPTLLKKYEKKETEFDIGDESCDSGVCPIR